MKNNIIEIKNLKKSYGEVKAVDDISFEVEKGSLFAFLGINGAGKSTTINILCSILDRDEGKIEIDGLDFDSNKQKLKDIIGIVFQTSVLDDRLTVKENLMVRASYYGLRGDALKTRIAELTNMLDLKDILKRPFSKLSGGQKRRVDLARGLLNKPKILFLDEPTTGLDPKTRGKVWEVLMNLQKENGTTLFLTTHYMEEANKADNVVIMDSGKIVAIGTPLELKNKYSGDYIRLYTEQKESISALLKAEEYENDYTNEGYSIRVKNSEQAKAFLLKHSDLLSDFEVIKGDMDDVFLNVTGKALEVRNA